jgi:hypothetical protein
VSGRGSAAIFPPFEVSLFDQYGSVAFGRSNRGKATVEPVTFVHTVTFRLCIGSVVLNAAFMTRGTSCSCRGELFFTLSERQFWNLTRTADVGMIQRLAISKNRTCHVPKKSICSRVEERTRALRDRVVSKESCRREELSTHRPSSASREPCHSSLDSTANIILWSCRSCSTWSS